LHNPVDLQKFVGALAGQGAKKGIFITTSNFTKEAIEYTPRNETKIVLIDGEQLAQLMIDYNLIAQLSSVLRSSTQDPSLHSLVQFHTTAGI